MIDEAITYNDFVSGPWRKLFGRFDANNHILSSVAVKLSVALGGLSPFTLRLPSMVAGLFLVLGVFRLLKRVESPVVRWGAYAVVCLSPMLLDFSIAARGYSLSLALFVWGLFFAMERRYRIAGVLLGLSFAANIAILFPILALLAVFMLFERRSFLRLAIPAVILAAAITYPSLRRAHRDDFYVGYPEFSSALKSFVSTSLYATNRDGIFGDRGNVEAASPALLALFLTLVGAAAFWTTDWRRLIPFLILVVTLAGLCAAHWLFGVKYPADRTCLYFVILGAISWAIAADSTHNRLVQGLSIVVMLAVSIQFSTQLQTRYFQFWQEETEDQRIAMIIAQACAGKAVGSMAIGATWIHQPTLEFYRRYLRITALKPVERFDAVPLEGFDFYVLSWGDVERARQTRLRVVFEGRDIVFAEP